MLTLGDIEEGECEGPALERTDENMDRGRYQGDQSVARDNFDLNHTIHSRLGERISDDLGFSIEGQESDSGTAGFMEGLVH